MMRYQTQDRLGWVTLAAVCGALVGGFLANSLNGRVDAIDRRAEVVTVADRPAGTAEVVDATVRWQSDGNTWESPVPVRAGTRVGDTVTVYQDWADYRLMALEPGRTPFHSVTLWVLGGYLGGLALSALPLTAGLWRDDRRQARAGRAATPLDGIPVGHYGF